MNNKHQIGPDWTDIVIVISMWMIISAFHFYLQKHKALGGSCTKQIPLSVETMLVKQDIACGPDNAQRCDTIYLHQKWKNEKCRSSDKDLAINCVALINVNIINIMILWYQTLTNRSKAHEDVSVCVQPTCVPG